MSLIPSLLPMPTIRAASLEDLTPGIGTYKDVKEFIDNPTWFNAAMAAWGGLNDALFLFTKNGGLRSLGRAGQQYVRSQIKKKAILIANPRAVARVSQQKALQRDAVRLAKRAIVKNKKQDFGVETFDNTFQDYFNGMLPPLWLKYNTKQ